MPVSVAAPPRHRPNDALKLNLHMLKTPQVRSKRLTGSDVAVQGPSPGSGVGLESRLQATPIPTNPTKMHTNSRHQWLPCLISIQLSGFALDVLIDVIHETLLHADVQPRGLGLEPSPDLGIYFPERARTPLFLLFLCRHSFSPLSKLDKSFRINVGKTLPLFNLQERSDGSRRLLHEDQLADRSGVCDVPDVLFFDIVDPEGVR